MINKKSIKLFMIFFMLFSVGIVQAQELVQEDITIAGITPDSNLYNLDLFFERVMEFFNDESKINHAIERLSEVKVMISEGDLTSSEIAIMEFEKIRLRTKDRNRLREHKEVMDQLGLKIDELDSEIEITVEQKEIFYQIIENSQNRIQQEISNWNKGNLENNVLVNN